MVEVTQGAQKRNFLYDSLGRLIRVKQPEQEINASLNKTDPTTGNSQWTAGFKYDVVGKLIKSTDAKGVNIINEYDGADRVLKRCYTKPGVSTSAQTCSSIAQPDQSTDTPAVCYKYDLTNGSIQNSKGQLIETSSSVSTSRTSAFDQYGRPTEYQQITDGTTYTSKYIYNLSGALIEEEYPSGRKVKHEFDPNGDLERVWGTNGTLNYVYANGFKYTASGGIERMRLGNGLWETAQFNERLQVTSLGLGHSVANDNLWKVNYAFGEFDSSGNIDQTKNTGNIAKQTISFSGLTQPFEQEYRYDSLYRLTEAKEKVNGQQEPNWSQNFGYDRYGNRLSHTKNINGSLVNNTVLDHPAIDPATNRIAAGQVSTCR
ncbi:MAG: hypothetical protein OEM82_10860 [Acidobacteriota bacterium]|nr:hypothetical protein [Acidobacteriota bacterium]MDH3530296.1 hypothetical protein [Acidobacteriota bacterium]